MDNATGHKLSPYYPPSQKLAVRNQDYWQKQLAGASPVADAPALPLLPAWEKTGPVSPRAISRAGVVPQGYTSGELAELACQNAGKRLCRLEEWRTACRGERGHMFPYGPSYIDGRCNVFRQAHPAQILHGNASIGHTDPRLNLVRSEDKPLLRRTGDTPECRSIWGNDAVFDMVGNVDEWVDDPEGTFVGGFYSRAKRDGCASTVTTHGFDYYDYSTGIRCCADSR